MSPRSERERIQDIVRAIDVIGQHREHAHDVGLSPNDSLVLDAVVRQLAIIGEAASHLSEDLTTRHDQIRWRGVKGMRLMLDHEYHRVDAGIVWRTVDEDLPALRSALAKEL